MVSASIYLSLWLDNKHSVVLPDKTVYDTESGSYFDSYNSFKQIRAPVVLMYCKIKQKYINHTYFSFYVDLAFVATTEGATCCAN